MLKSTIPAAITTAGADAEDLVLINSYTRRELKPEDVYIFCMSLCDNDIDRDGEAFADASLDVLSGLFTGKTGIFDHDWRTSNQTARIYKCAVIADPQRKNYAGADYRYLKAWAYMLRSAKNSDIIADIDGGIKREVSVGCKIGAAVCSICGARRTDPSCEHAAGASYGGKPVRCC